MKYASLILDTGSSPTKFDIFPITQSCQWKHLGELLENLPIRE